MYRNFKLATERTETAERRNARDTLLLSGKENRSIFPREFLWIQTLEDRTSGHRTSQAELLQAGLGDRYGY